MFFKYGGKMLSVKTVNILKRITLAVGLALSFCSINYGSATRVFTCGGIRICPICPSSGLTPDEADAIARSWGVDVSRYITGSSEDQVFADPIKKFHLLDDALRSNADVVWAVRGGYGLDKVMPMVIGKHYPNRKIIIGYSDSSSLLIYMSQRHGWQAINGPSLKEMALGSKSLKSRNAIMDFLEGRVTTLRLNGLVPINAAANTAGALFGKVTGGNLTCVVSGIGAPWCVWTDGRILFLEDTNVDGYRLDRLLAHLKHAGLLNGVVAIVFGNFGGGSTKKVLKNFANQLKIPVYQTLQFGHENENMPIGYEFHGTIMRVHNEYELTMRQ
ncbi:MAG: LD-carboxypeptidase [Holosporales bacterium]|jgi:muramoyltetrapeptide carboxypeptidase|nr:LD-carboxypeptidase [Holosporales bacterium]